MKIERDYVLAYLKKLEEQYDGYFGTDIFNLAEELGVTCMVSGRSSYYGGL